MNHSNDNNQIGFGGRGGGGGGGREDYRQQQHRSFQNQHLGVNMISKNIRKSPIHQPNFPTNPIVNKQQQNLPPQPQVYNINKNDFRNIVQQLTGTPSRDPSPNPIQPPSVPPPPRPASLPRSPSMRLQRIRPPPLAPIARPAVAVPNSNPNFNSGFLPRGGLNPNLNPNPNGGYVPRGALGQPMAQVPNALWLNAAESPVSLYMRYLESSVLNPEGIKQPQLPSPQSAPTQLPPSLQKDQTHWGQQPPPSLQKDQTHWGQQPPPSSGQLPDPPQKLQHHHQHPGTTGSTVPSSMSSPAIPSPSAFLSLLSPRSHYPALSPTFQFPPPLSPTFMLSPLSQSGGILSSFAQPLASPTSLFPLSPSGFLSPRWRDM